MAAFGAALLGTTVAIVVSMKRAITLADLGWTATTYRVFGRNASRITTPSAVVSFDEVLTSQRVSVANAQYQLRGNDNAGHGVK